MPPKITPACQELVTMHRPDAVVFGHSHKHGICQHNGVLYINPGSAGPARFKLPRTVAILRLPSKADTTVLSCDLVSFITLDAKAPSRIAASKSNKRTALYRCKPVQKKTRE
ncbi:MAG: hypothetical protein FRX49_11585 [Trebouxia sp. A1-2]|nr:MAG: hypothetical protein FRX49_11585 [Trebouxia sp. A1-2]